MAVKKIVYKNHDFEINYEIINPQISENNIVFLHGWGSNKEVMKSGFASKLNNFKHIYIDMPGFGKSPNEVVLTTYDYSEIMKLFFASLEIDYHQITIVGHSFGGKVATYLSPKNLILLSTAGIVEEKSTKVKTKIKLAKLANALGVSFFSKLFRSKDVNTMSEVMYGTFKNVVDEDFRNQFASYNGNALIFWGINDTATSLKSGEKIHQLIKNSQFFPLDGDHYFFLKNSDTIEQILKDNIK